MATKKPSAAKDERSEESAPTEPKVTAPQFASQPEAKHPREDDHGGWINGEPATREEVEESTK